jgi:hypothetical protein
MAALSEWLQIMLAEIARKREDLERAREEERAREADASREVGLTGEAHSEVERRNVTTR